MSLLSALSLVRVYPGRKFTANFLIRLEKLNLIELFILISTPLVLSYIPNCTLLGFPSFDIILVVNLPVFCNLFSNNFDVNFLMSYISFRQLKLI